MALATFEKQPAEVQDYDIDFATSYLADLADTAVSHTVAFDPGIEVPLTTMSDGVVKVWVSGGTSGQKYKITATITTVGGRVREGEILVKVKEL